MPKPDRPFTPVNVSNILSKINDCEDLTYLMSSGSEVKIDEAILFILLQIDFELIAKEESVAKGSRAGEEIYKFNFTGVRALNLDQLKISYLKKYKKDDFDDKMKIALDVINSDVALLSESYLDKSKGMVVFNVVNSHHRKVGNAFITNASVRGLRVSLFEDEYAKNEAFISFSFALKEKMNNYVAKFAMKKFGIDVGRYRELEPRSHELKPALGAIFEDSGSSLFMRDRLIMVGRNYYVTGDFDALSGVKKVGANEGFLIREESLMRAATSDLLASGIKAKYPPFTTEGGNIAFSERKDGSKLVLFCTSNYVHNINSGNFLGAKFEDEIYTKSQYDKYSSKIKDWFKGHGYNHAINVKRNLEKYSFAKIYHLDIFLLAIGDILILHEDAIEPESMKEIADYFSDENIIRISKEDMLALATNSIVFDDKFIVFSSPDISDELLKKLAERGFSYALPPFTLNRDISLDEKKVPMDHGLRCATQELPIKTKAVSFKPLSILPERQIPDQ